MGNLELVFRSIGAVVMAIGIGLFVFRKSQGGAKIAILNQEVSVASESLIIFIVGVGLFVFPDLYGLDDSRQRGVAAASSASNGGIESAQSPDAQVPASAGPDVIGTQTSSETIRTAVPSGISIPESSPRTSASPDVLAIRAQWWSAASEGDTGKMAQMLDAKLVTIKTAIDDKADTALHMASERCDDEAVRFLLLRGADPLRKNAFNDSSIRIAEVRCPPPAVTAELLRMVRP